jgi:hypothetical protein
MIRAGATLANFQSTGKYYFETYNTMASTGYLGNGTAAIGIC